MVFSNFYKEMKRNINSKIKQPSNVYNATYLLYIIGNILGLSPFALKRIENGKRVFEDSLWQILRSASLATGLILLLGYCLYYCEILYDSNVDFKMKLRVTLQFFSSFTSAFEIILACIFANKIIEVFKNIDDIDTEFRQLAVWVPYKQIYVQIYIHLVLVVLADVGFFLLFEFHVKRANIPVTTFSLYVFMGIILLQIFINNIMDLQYIHYVNVLRMRYKLLNEYLEALIHDNKSYNGWVDEPDTTEKSDDKFGKIPKSIVAISDPIFVVDQVAALHIKITDTAHLINFAFCVQQLLRVAIAFVSIVMALFSIARSFSASGNDGPGAYLDLYFLVWAVCNALEIMTIVWITSETCEEANTCPRILHRIRNNTTNTKLQDTIEIYSLQMYHNRLHFTICGLFPLDYTLLYTIVAGVTTYLVILIQFSGNEFLKKSNVTGTQ